MIIKVPEVTWALGDPEQSTASGVTVTTRPIYYKGKRAGAIDPDYAEPLMALLLAPKPSPSVADSPTCQREIMRSADDSAAYLSVKCTCGKCPSTPAGAEQDPQA